MSYVIAAPEMMTSAASDLAAIGSNVNAAHMVAAARTTSVIPAAADEVSAGVAHLFSSYAQDFHGLAAKAAAFGDQFTTNLKAGAFSYSELEAGLTAFLHPGDFLPWLYSQFGVGPVVGALAAIELAILIPVLLVTSPIWIPLLILASPVLLLGLLLLAGLLGA
jgi:hypothetical protein